VALNYNNELEALEGTITVVPALVLAAEDSEKLVVMPYGTSLTTAIERLEANNHPDTMAILEFETKDNTYRFEFPPGPPAEDALRVLKWFRDAIEFAGPLNLGRQ
jgi:hypothetical protein